jgi:hypothetical protein
LPAADYPAESVLPGILGKRKVNRGFEGAALSSDEKTVYAVLQSPLLIPDRATGDTSRITRVLALDVATERIVAEYAYRFDQASGYGASAVPADMKLSAVVALNPTTLLILERTDQVAKLYMVDLETATNLLGSPWDDAGTTPSLEALDEPSAAGVIVLPKTLVLDLSTLAGMPEKIEGLAVVDKSTIAIANDNDFDFTGFDEPGMAIPAGVKNQLLVISLANPLP